MEKYRPIVHDVLIRGFYPNESVCSGVGVTKEPEAVAQLNLLVDNALLDGVSLLARRAENDEIVGVAINKIQTKCQPGEKGYFERFISENITNPTATLLIQFMSAADAKVDLFGEMKVERLVECMFLCVLPEASGAGVGRALVGATEDVAKQLSISAVSALFTSSASQAIGKAMGFRVFDVYPHSEFLANGRPIAESLREDQQFTQICGKVLS